MSTCSRVPNKGVMLTMYILFDDDKKMKYKYHHNHQQKNG